MKTSFFLLIFAAAAVAQTVSNPPAGASVGGAPLCAGLVTTNCVTNADNSGNISTAGGDLSGTLPSPTVAKVNGHTPGNTCTNQFTRSIDSSARGTCASIAASDLSATVIPVTPVSSPGTSVTLAGPRGYGICTGTCTVTVPAPVAGYEFCVMNDDNVSTAITLSALGSSAMYENSARTAYGTAGTGTLVLSAAAANKVCIVGRDATHYFTVSYNGAVTVN